MTRRRRFGAVRKLPSGRWQAHYVHAGQKVRAQVTFETRIDAEGWLRAAQRGEIPATAEPTRTTFGEYAETWLVGRDLKPRTRAHYRHLLDSRLLPTFADAPLRSIDPATVRKWHAAQDATTPTSRAHAYALLKAILATAVSDDLIEANPCRIRAAGSSKRVRTIRPATLAEVAALVEAMPSRYRAMTLLAAWCGLRFGELTELRRSDLDLEHGVVRVQRAVVRVNGQVLVGTPKSDAGTRDVAIPPHLLPVLADHLRAGHAESAPGGLLFPAPSGGHLPSSSLYWHFYQAREAAGRPDLRWHDLRHTGAVLAAATGATLAELMARLGHTTAGVAMRYQHAAADRDQAIARELSRLAGG